MSSIVRPGVAARGGAVLLFVGPLVAWGAELITAAAWQNPHYSPFYNWVSHLGLTGPRQVAFGQVADSPLGAVMDTGWVLYGVLLIVGALLAFDLRQGLRPITIVVLAILSGVGVSLVGIVQGSNANVANGLIALHSLGAQGVMLAGNIMVIVVGVNGAGIGLGRSRRIASIVLGLFGLVAFPVFMVDVFTGWMWNIGLLERAVIYPIMIGQVLLGRGLIARHISHRQPAAAGR
ncbi:DUF998 domain-containing protein [Pseudonocardia xinjiangensis]|uniref:DUF998 domain-containing protein n=1 Tax=Pseudonocardia xinjiangensis TaxID=75289 RepID=A0ABX1R5T8_9PSEU|nr:DUF998 domain-containing protein [Pseudonocardia xinjiangensis]NMH75766.1 DUF998 domain-containing protein [Pseudonocardia xinjiangensis]